MVALALAASVAALLNSVPARHNVAVPIGGPVGGVSVSQVAQVRVRPAGNIATMPGRGRTSANGVPHQAPPGSRSAVHSTSAPAPSGAAA